MYRLVTALVWLGVVSVIVIFAAEAWRIQAMHRATLAALANGDYATVFEDVAPYYKRPWTRNEDSNTAAEIDSLPKPLPERYVQDNLPHFYSRIREAIEVANTQRWKALAKRALFIVPGILVIGGVFQLLWRWVMSGAIKRLGRNRCR